MIKKESKNVS